MRLEEEVPVTGFGDACINNTEIVLQLAVFMLIRVVSAFKKIGGSRYKANMDCALDKLKIGNSSRLTSQILDLYSHAPSF